MEEIIAPVSTEKLYNEIQNLPDENLLTKSNELYIFIAEAQHITHILREIGRLREITFRRANEGTGKSVDLDEYDNFYTHLFLWNDAQKELVGAYRIALTDKLIREHGFTGLYTSTLFQFENQIAPYLSNTIELGRSFIKNEYQKTPIALSLLWRGIGKYVLTNQTYHKLIGSVSISQDYQEESKRFIIRYIQKYRWNSDLSRYAHPRNPVKMPEKRMHNNGEVISERIDDISQMISEIEPDNKGLPVLLRQYLKFNGHFFSFTMDPSFMNTLVGLMLVDLRKTDKKIMRRFMGFDGYKTFCRINKINIS